MVRGRRGAARAVHLGRRQAAARSRPASSRTPSTRSARSNAATLARSRCATSQSIISTRSPSVFRARAQVAVRLGRADG
eukprot:4911130-Prymnesium_polylepis.1